MGKRSNAYYSVAGGCMSLPVLPNYATTVLLKEEEIASQAIEMAEKKYKWGLEKIRNTVEKIENKKITLRKKMYIDKIMRMERDHLEELYLQVSMHYSSMGVSAIKRIRESDNLFFDPIINRTIHQKTMCNEFFEAEKKFNEEIKVYEVKSKTFREYRSQLTEYINIIRRKCELELLLNISRGAAINIHPSIIC